MNVYEKLQSARIAYQSRNPKMSGKNTYAGYTYFELADILPVINVIAKELGFICEVSFTGEIAQLIFRDTEKPSDFIPFTSPMSTAQLKGCHEVQNLGAVETYIKRYLYQNAFEIVESDALNGTQGKPEKRPETDDEKRARVQKEYTDLVASKIDGAPRYTADEKKIWNARLKEVGYAKTIAELKEDQRA